MLVPPASSQLSEIELLRRASSQRFWYYLIGGLFCSLCLGVAFVAFGLNSPLLPLLMMTIIAMPVVLWHKPIVGIYVILAGVCLFELFPRGMPGVFSDCIPLFWNVNTIIQRYAHAGFEAIPLSPLELIIAQIAGLSAIRGIFTRTARFKFGPIGGFLGVYLFFVLFAWLNGLGHGGDFKISLQEVRSQVYLVFAYLLAVNFVDKRHLPVLLWITGVCIALKGFDYTWRRYSIFGGQSIPDQGVGSHEEAFFFVCFFMLLAILVICRAYPRLAILMGLCAPLVMLGNVATNRRAGSAALILCVPALVLIAYRAFPQYRRAVILGIIVAGLLWFPYYQAFKHSNGVVGTLARSVRSKQEPDERDLSSNNYRDAEDANLFYTVQQSPVIGYGYGRPFIVVVPMADISEVYEYWNIMPHDQVLWVWMRVGSLGFVAFWMMYASMLIVCTRVAVEENGPGRVAGMFAATSATALTVFGLYDLQFSNYRDMLFIGFWVGIASIYYKPSKAAGWEWQALILSNKPARNKYEDGRTNHLVGQKA